MTKAASIPLETYERAAAALRVLAHPHRLKIIELLLTHEHTVGELAEQLGLAPAAVSQHLNHMKAHGLLDSQRYGRSVYYRVVNPQAANVIACIRKYGADP